MYQFSTSREVGNLNRAVFENSRRYETSKLKSDETERTGGEGAEKPVLKSRDVGEK